MTNQLFSRAGVRYEVALDVLGAIIAHHSEAIAAEREKATPDEAVIAAAQKAKDELRTIREDLDPNARRGHRARFQTSAHSSPGERLKTASR